MAVLFVSCGFAFGQGLNDGLVAYYPLNGNANDASGNNRHLSTQGQPTFEEGINGLLSAQFDDNADGFEITGQDTPENIGAASVSVWFEQDDPSGSQVFVGLTRARTSRFIIYLENGLIHYQHGMERGGRLEGGIFENQPTLSNGWNNFVLTTSGNGGKISGYLNGQFLGDVSAGINLTGLTDYMIGAYTELAPADQYRQAFRGSIQNLRIYNRALSEQEVTTLYGIESQNTQFQIIEGNFTWQEAKEDAETKGGRLAVLDTQAKIDAANAFIQPDDPGVWIGLTDEAQEGQWKWITGEPLTVSNWYEGEPNNLGNEDYATIWSDTLAWNDAQGSNTGAYLLEILGPQKQITILDLENGSVTGGGVFSLQGEATLTATPSAGYVFVGWNGDASGNTNPLTVTMDANKSIGATFTIDTRDPDGDGLSNYQELVVLNTNPNNPDSDGDGYNDGQEQSEGTDPNDAGSFPNPIPLPIPLRVEKLNVPGLVIFAYWTGEAGKSYRLEYSADYQNWSILDSGILSDGSEQSRFLPARKGLVRIVEES